MFSKIKEKVRGEEAVVVRLSYPYSLKDTLECGQCFRYEAAIDTEGYSEYLIPVADVLVRVGQREAGELIFYGAGEEELSRVIVPFFALDLDFGEIKKDIVSRTDSDWLRTAADFASGIAILRQEPWEALFSFIISQNNNIPRIRKIIRALSAEYGKNLAIERGLSKCPVGRIDGAPCQEKCASCGICYSFPGPDAVCLEPEKMLPSKPGFRYKYLLDAAEKVASGSLDLNEIASLNTYGEVIEGLKTISGVGDKVASCVALFGFGRLEAFPIDVWMRRAIDEYFAGKLDPISLGKYAGVAQQYIFHYIRHLSEAEG